MKLWLGHYLGAPDQWFVAWGETKMDAARYVDEIWGAPDVRSMRPVQGVGAVNFRVEDGVDDEGARHVYFHNADDGEEELVMDLGGADGDEANEDWILKCVDAPFEGEEEAEHLLDTYVEDDSDDLPDCDCFWERDVLNLPCVHYDRSPATPGACVKCEHDPHCHPKLGVAP